MKNTKLETNYLIQWPKKRLESLAQFASQVKGKLALLALMTFLPLQAHAITITVKDDPAIDESKWGVYELETVTGYFSAHVDDLITQNWWGDKALSGYLAEAVGLGFTQSDDNTIGAYFATDYTEFSTYLWYTSWDQYPGKTGTVVHSQQIHSNDREGIWVIAKSVTPVSDETSTILLLGSTLIGFCMFARNRKSGRS